MIDGTEPGQGHTIDRLVLDLDSETDRDGVEVGAHASQVGEELGALVEPHDGEDDRRGIAGVVTYADEMVFVLDTQAIARLAEPVASAPKHARGA